MLAQNRILQVYFTNFFRFKYLYQVLMGNFEKVRNWTTGPLGAFCQFLFRLIYYCHSSKSTGKETGKTHLCAVLKISILIKYPSFDGFLGPLNVIWQASFACRITWSTSSWQEHYKNVVFSKIVSLNAFSVIQKNMWLLEVWQNLCFGQFYY